ncbi:MAG: hypothetical protein UT20_C0019G0005 [Candidatus Levybacteria bacterium GW2011_GWA1_39_11]|nr:MAG: hypothetical protein UT20_C0019G0005 [Candidatus Levybacteria bacterium GW2011_GWA1_39_11]KKR27507.1 MAG: hypothetical protein UT57_C0003G0021 [Microgenomates group bacterium GW2011_GWC1_39_7]
MHLLAQIDRRMRSLGCQQGIIQRFSESACRQACLFKVLS